ncbi:MAG: CBS domain-containing protein [Caldilineaceae bacterium]
MQVDNILATKGSNVVTVKPTQLIREVLALLAEYNVGALVVTDESDRCVGIISERDVVRRAAVDEDVFTLPVSEVMSTKVIVGQPHHDLLPVAHTMIEKRIRHLPIVESERVVGIISIGDVLKAQRDQYQGQVETLTIQILADE